jgi:hypothetical protein
MEHVSARHLAENEATFRQLNERFVEGVAESDALAVEHGQLEYRIGPRIGDQMLLFFCECSNGDCTRRVQLTLHEYEEIHKFRDHFVVAPGHEEPAIEHVVIHHEPEYNVVEKLESVPLVDAP